MPSDERSGPYLGMRAVVMGFQFPGTGGGGGLDFRGGYRFGRWISAEAEFEWIHIASDTSVYTATVGAKFHFLRWGNGEFVANCSAGLMTENRNTAVFVARFGGGFDLHMTSNLSLDFGATYVMPSGDLTEFRDGGDSDYISGGIGLSYRF